MLGLPLRLFTRGFAARVPVRAYSSSKPSSRLPTSFTPPPAPPRSSPLAAVASTAHLQPTEIAISRFFAQHRPLSFSAPVEEQPVTTIVLPRAFDVPPAPVPQDKEWMWAISVKRQRKLKMKKHKYKKLMKRTRNLRRRIERAKN